MNDMNTKTRAELERRVSWILTDDGNAINPDDTREPSALREVAPGDTLVAYGDEVGDALVVAVRSYLPDTKITAEEAIDIAQDWLTERGYLDSAEAVAPRVLVGAGPAMKTLLENDVEMLRGVARAYHEPEDAFSFDELVYRLSRCAKAVHAHPECTGTEAVNRDPAVQILVHAICRQAGFSECGPGAEDYANAHDLCERGYRCESHRDRSPLTERDYQGALESQTACNLIGLANTLNRLAPRIIDDCQLSAGRGITVAPARHPIAVLYATQLQHLAEPKPDQAYTAILPTLHRLNARETDPEAPAP